MKWVHSDNSYSDESRNQDTVCADAIRLYMGCCGTACFSASDAQRSIDLALKNNLTVLVAGTQAGEAAGSTERAFSTLLPHVSGDVLENRQNRNLETAGISLPAIPTVVGPFSFTDFRVFASQTLVDRQAYHSWKSAARQESAACAAFI